MVKSSTYEFNDQYYRLISLRYDFSREIVRKHYNPDFKILLTNGAFNNRQ